MNRIRRGADAAAGYLLTGMIFALPVSTAASNILAGLLLAAWLVRADFRADWRELTGNPVAVAALGLFALFVLGLAWSEDPEQGLAVVRKEWKLLLLPVFLFCARREHAGRYVDAYLLSMALCVVLSFAVWFELVPPFNRATVADPVPFGTHVVYNPLLAVAIYLLALRLVFERGARPLRRAADAAALVAMTFNMFVTGGRAGQVMFFAALALVCLQAAWPRRGEGNRRAAFAAAGAGAVLLTALVFSVAWFAGGTFRERVQAVAEDVGRYGADPASPVGERLAYWSAGMEVFLAHPLIGAGTGDLPAELDRVLDERGVEVRRRPNPHSMYVMVMGQLGVAGLAALLWLFYAQLRTAMAGAGPVAWRMAGAGLPPLFALVCLAESYLAVHATALLFAAFSGFLYKGEPPARGAPAP